MHVFINVLFIQILFYNFRVTKFTVTPCVTHVTNNGRRATSALSAMESLEDLKRKSLPGKTFYPLFGIVIENNNNLPFLVVAGFVPENISLRAWAWRSLRTGSYAGAASGGLRRRPSWAGGRKSHV